MTVRPKTNREAAIRIDSKVNLLLMVLMIGTITLGCSSGSSGLPELRPGKFKEPDKTETHGRIVEKHYQSPNGPRTIFYKILEVDGSPLRIPRGYVKNTAYCEVDGIEAVAFTVRGKPKDAGVYILHIKDDKQTLVRLCDYQMFLGQWTGPVFSDCGLLWDAKTMTQTKDPSFTSTPENDQE